MNIDIECVKFIKAVNSCMLPHPLSKGSLGLISKVAK